jgi:hypothetical protein
MAISLSNPNDHQYPYGYYLVNNEKFDHKISALIRATKVNTRPTWHFHREIYNQLDWQQDSAETLSNVYQRRARQLREKYDYVAISFSGGSDSWTVINSFISSKSHIDEIFVRWPITGTQGKYQANGQNTHASNILSEWELTILPMLKEYSKIIPQTKITIHDWSNDLHHQELTDKNWALTQDYLNPGSFLKFCAISSGEQTAIDSGLKTTIVFGTDKPQLCVNQGNVYCYFLDKLANSHAYADFYRNSELFYWSPDLPELTHVQARALYHSIVTNPKIASMIDFSKPCDPLIKQVWNQISRSIIYPEYSKLNTFQANKSYTNVFDEVDLWMSAHKDLRYNQSWKYGLNNVFSSIAPHFFDRREDEITGFGGFIDGMYLLGPASMQG